MPSWLWLLLGVALFVIPPRLERARKRRSRRRRVRYKYRPMELYVGPPGSGKSYELTRSAIESLAEGRKIAVNFRLRFLRVYVALRVRYGLSSSEAVLCLSRIQYVKGWDDLMTLRDCDLYWDEVQADLPASEWMLIPHAAIQTLAIHRHLRIRVRMATHRFGALQVYVREGLIATVYHVAGAGVLRRAREAFDRRGLPILVYREIKNPGEEILKSPSRRGGFMRRMTGSRSVKLDPVIASCYDHEGGRFPSFLDEQRRQKAKGRVYEVAERSRRLMVANDGLPWLSDEEWYSCVLDGRSPHVELAERIRHQSGAAESAPERVAN